MIVGDDSFHCSEVVAKYTQEMRRMGLEMLELLCEGLGLDPKYCSGGLSESPLLLAHHYPPCPEPSLTLGAPKHRDPNLVTILLQEKDINALQVFKDGEWIVVEPIPYAFVVNIGLMLQVISNGRLIGAEHRVVTNSEFARTTVAYFIRPTSKQIIEPAKSLISSGARPIYRSIVFEEFLKNFMIKGADIEQELLFLTWASEYHCRYLPFRSKLEDHRTVKGEGKRAVKIQASESDKVASARLVSRSHKISTETFWRPLWGRAANPNGDHKEHGGTAKHQKQRIAFVVSPFRGGAVLVCAAVRWCSDGASFLPEEEEDAGINGCATSDYFLFNHLLSSFSFNQHPLETRLQR
ncbi:hypothetical protein V8G54_021345 [Vigna mungo]|uniref:Fe2OG dioxygenase domain-containing protein n=1 Tax=Vigna mungo TaxID=3915 RepID=A0AAQ3RX97_VIGMU